MSAGMVDFGSGPLVRIRQIVQPDMPTRGNRHSTQAPPNTLESRVLALLAATHPTLVTVMGSVRLVLILWLMLFKPF